MFNKEKLKEYLEENKLSWAKFGEMVGVSDAMVGYLIKGFKQPSIALLKRIATVMECSADELLCDEQGGV